MEWLMLTNIAWGMHERGNTELTMNKQELSDTPKTQIRYRHQRQ